MDFFVTRFGFFGENRLANLRHAANAEFYKQLKKSRREQYSTSFLNVV